MAKCFDCIYSRKIQGDTHLSCVHPSWNEIQNSPKNKTLNIKADFYGIRMGWFNMPFNFDPVWLESCDGFQSKYSCTSG